MKVIGITGKARAGKDTLAEAFCKNFGVMRIALADPIKMLCETLIKSCEDNDIWGEDSGFSEFFLALNSLQAYYDPEEIRNGWREACEIIRANHICLDSSKEVIRPLYQFVGTELMRKLSNGLFWIDILDKKLQMAKKAGLPGIVIPDVRFVNESQFLKANYDATVIRITKTTETIEISPECDSHLSEKEESVIEADYTLQFPPNSVEEIQKSAIELGRNLFPCESEIPYKILSRTDFKPLSFDKEKAVVEITCPFCMEKIPVTLNTFGKTEDVFKMFFFSCPLCSNEFSFRIHSFTIDNIYLYVGKKPEPSNS